MERQPRISVPRVDLFDKPTPLQHLSQLSRSLQATSHVDIWMKRDDTMSVGLGGTKLRNLELILADAQSCGADTLLAGGLPFNNHCRLAAAAGARAGMSVVIIFSGRKPANPGANERICALYGAELRYDMELLDDRSRLVEVVDELRAEGRRPYLIPAGASGRIGAGGPLLGALELAGQLADANISADYVFMGVSTGGTYTGLATGLWLARSDTRVVGVPTHLGDSRSGAELRVHIAELSNELRQFWSPMFGQVKEPAPDEILFDDLTDWVPFGATEPAAVAAASRIGVTEAIAIDPTYTARSLSGLIAWAEARRLEDKTVVLWNAGGTPALFEPSFAESRLSSSASTAPGGHPKPE